jgi:hypothetical protein
VSAPLASVDALDRLHRALGSLASWLSSFGVLDWILLAVAVLLLAWGWVWARAFATLGNIQVTDLTTDDTTLKGITAKAALQHELAQRGWLPAGGVPGGSPSIASIADAICKAPIPQASWVGGLIGLIPTPPTSTGFNISGTLMSAGAQVQLAYELVCTGPKPSVELNVAGGVDQPKAIAAAARDIYLKMTRSAPAMYPKWAQWSNGAALDAYGQGLELEKAPAPSAPAAAPASGHPRFKLRTDPSVGYTAAYDQYLASSQYDPENLLSRLRAANCLERMAAGEDDAAVKLCLQVQALATYVSVRLRQPDIFQAGFRASVLMSVLASEEEAALSTQPLVNATLTRLERSSDRYVDPLDSPDRRLRKTAATNLRRRLEQAAASEAKTTRRRLLPWWTILRENRFRHLFEPSGRERRQLRKALGISGLAQKARLEQRRPAPTWWPSDVWPPSEVRQVWWRALVSGRYMFGRWGAAGWQAHYNAACFYALLPQAQRTGESSGGLALRRRALQHLHRAFDQAAGALPGAYVRDEDPDLRALRELSPQRFANEMQRVCPDEVVVRLVDRDERRWTLHVWGEAVARPRRGAAEALPATDTKPKESMFRVRIFDENTELRFWAQAGDAIEDPGWKCVPAALLTSQISVVAGVSDMYGAAKPVPAAVEPSPPPVPAGVADGHGGPAGRRAPS